MKNNPTGRLNMSYGLLLMLVMPLHMSACGSKSTAKVQEDIPPVPYKILTDDMGTTISIGVDSEISDRQLMATLAKAATDHQNDAARDYLMVEYLWIDAYLLRGEEQSTVTAGRLRRYVPPRNPNTEEDTKIPKDDKFFITLDAAKNTLQ